jgi:hypothetical protein
MEDATGPPIVAKVDLPSSHLARDGLCSSHVEIIMRRTPFATLLAACLAVPTQDSAAAQGNPNPMLFAPDASPYGVSMNDWIQLEAQWLRAIPLPQNPLYDQSGAFCGLDQHGLVWFVPPIDGPPVFNGSRSCTIPHDRAILLDLGHQLDEFPCNALPGWQPAPGQSLYDFLVKDLSAAANGVNTLEVSLDGRPLSGVLAYRHISNDAFSLTSDLSLVARDTCITGQPQQAIVAGHYLMFKPLARGQHTLVVFGTSTSGDSKTYTYRISSE